MCLYILCTVPMGLAFFPSFPSFLGTSLDILYLFVRFYFCRHPNPPTPRLTTPDTPRKQNQGMGGFTFCFLACFNGFPGEDRGGRSLLFCTFVTFVHTGAFDYFFVLRGQARVATQMALRQGREGQERDGRESGSFSSRGRLLGRGKGGGGAKGSGREGGIPKLSFGEFFFINIFPEVDITYPIFSDFFEDL